MTKYRTARRNWIRQPPNLFLKYLGSASLEMRNANPEIARGELKTRDEYLSQTKYVCVMQRTWNGSTITIVVNLDREWEHDIKLDCTALGVTQMTYTLHASSNGDAARFDAATGALHLPPYSIVVLR